MIRFITHFDQNYLPQAIVMLRSLARHMSQSIELSILYLTETTGPALAAMRDQIDAPKIDAQLIDIARFEELYPILARVRQNRTWQEYCWTLEPAWVNHNLKQAAKGGLLVYVDADSWFCCDPIARLEGEMLNYDVGLTPHYFPEEQADRVRSVGEFNFGFGAFRPTERVRMIVEDWLTDTLKQCQAGGQNDQTHLDSWPERLRNRMCRLSRGFNIGPWQYLWANRNPEGAVEFIDDDGSYRRVVSWHFHEFRRGIGKYPVYLDGGEMWNMTNYPIRESTMGAVYIPYVNELHAVMKEMKRAAVCG